MYCKEHDPDLLCITETESKRTDTLEWQPVIQGYSYLADKTGRGVGIFIKQDVNVIRKENYESFKPAIICEIVGGEDTTIVGVVYRSPNISKNDDEKLNNMIENIYKDAKPGNNIVITGDFNHPEINWESESTPCRDDHPSSKFIELIQDNFLYQAVREPTHYRGTQSANILDLILTNSDTNIIDLKQDSPIGKSHHVILNFKIPFAQVRQEQVKETNTPRYLVNKGKYDDFNKFIDSHKWYELLNNNVTVEDSLSIIDNVLNEGMLKFIPTTSSKKRTARKRVPESILEFIRVKRRAFKHYKKFRTNANKKAYDKARADVKRVMRRNKKNHETKLAKNIKDDPKSFYAYVSSVTKPREKIGNLLKDDGSLTKDNQEKADIFNTFFSSVFTQENLSNIPNFESRTSTTISNVEISLQDMKDKLESLNACKSPGPDGIHPRVLKELYNSIAVPLKILFDKTLESGSIPNAWKKAEVKPIFKKGSKLQAGNYRPVSLTSVVCKIFEHFIRDGLTKHMVDNKLLSDQQYGFTKGRSCVTQLLTTINDWIEFQKEGHPTDVIYLDLQKAFDKVPHCRLLTKLYGYGIRGNLYKWIEDFLSMRSQFVSIGNDVSPTASVTSGVPQGSVLGPTLFIYYINDMPDIVSSLIKIFADDTKIYRPIITNDDHVLLQKSLNNLVEWSNEWQMKFNESKCCVVHIGNNNDKKDYVMNGVNLFKSTAEKDLGVLVDENLSFNEHVNAVTKKANQIAGMILYNITNRDKYIMVPLFKALVRPILEYANVVWCPFLKKDKDKVEKVQRRFTKRIKGMKGLNYEDRLKALKLPSLEYRRLRGDLIEVFKTVHHINDPSTTSSLFNMYKNVCNITRGHDLKLKKSCPANNKHAIFFTNRVINHWNNLPDDTVNAGTLCTFKIHIDNYLSKLQYVTNLGDPNSPVHSMLYKL